MLPASYLEAHRYDGAAIAARPPRPTRAVRGPAARRRDRARRLALQVPHRTAAASSCGGRQRSAQAGRPPPLKLFDAGHLERFRPLARRGSFPWTYHLGADRPPPAPARRHHRTAPALHRPRTIYDYGHVLHELQLNAWVLAVPPRPRRRPARLGRRDRHRTAAHGPPGAAAPRRRLVSRRPPRPARRGPSAPTPCSRSQRDRRRASRGCSSSSTTAPGASTRTTTSSAATTPSSARGGATRPLGDSDQPPFVLFVCQDEDQRDQFLAAADRELPATAGTPAPARAPRVRRPPTHPLRARARRPRRRARGLATPRLPARPPRATP